MQQAEQAGLEGYLLKPVSPSTLFDAIMQAFGKDVSAPARIQRGAEKKPNGLKHIEGARVLLVEDNEINQQVAMEILQGAGLNVTVANNGQEGLEAAMQNPYDAILMDIQMPVMDGYAATRKIREWETEVRGQKSEVREQRTEVRTQRTEDGRQKAEDRGQRSEYREQEAEDRIRDAEGGVGNKMGKDSALISEFRIPTSDFKRVPIIAMTAHAMAGDDKKSIAAGMNDHVTKPIDPDQLFATLQKWIQPSAERAAVPKGLPASGGPPVHKAPPEPDQAMPVEDELPESLPGFDLTSGLKRLRGNKRLYRKLLVDFGTKYTETAREIRDALDAKDVEQAHSLVHNLKGLAGNLEATDLQAAAVELEKLVKGDQKKMASNIQLDQQFMELEKAINQALAAVRTLGLPAEEKIIETSAEWSADVPVEQLKEIAGRIKAAAEMGDVVQIKSIAEELKSESDAMAPFCDELIRLADDFDFDGIQKIVLELN
jgi:CheY-like chemotaxis protein